MGVAPRTDGSSRCTPGSRSDRPRDTQRQRRHQPSHFPHRNFRRLLRLKPRRPARHTAGERSRPRRGTPDTLRHRAHKSRRAIPARTCPRRCSSQGTCQGHTPLADTPSPPPPAPAAAPDLNDPSWRETKAHAPPVTETERGAALRFSGNGLTRPSSRRRPGRPRPSADDPPARGSPRRRRLPCGSGPSGCGCSHPRAWRSAP
jgi:hypothetical protein